MVAACWKSVNEIYVMDTSLLFFPFLWLFLYFVLSVAEVVFANMDGIYFKHYV